MWDVTSSDLILNPPVEFLLTHPVWDVTYPRLSSRPEETFLLTHPVWDVTLLSVVNHHITLISTHTSRVGCDARTMQYSRRFFISTHTSRVGCDYVFGGKARL